MDVCINTFFPFLILNSDEIFHTDNSRHQCFQEDITESGNRLLPTVQVLLHFGLRFYITATCIHRSYLFLCACGNGKLLVECAMNEANSLTDSSPTLAVLQVLQEYTRRNGFRSVKSIQF